MSKSEEPIHIALGEWTLEGVCCWTDKTEVWLGGFDAAFCVSYEDGRKLLSHLGKMIPVEAVVRFPATGGFASPPRRSL